MVVNNVFNCVSDQMLIWRALKTMPFGILLAWSYLSLWMLRVYFIWRAVVKVGWPVWSWSWLLRLIGTSVKLLLILIVLEFIHGFFFVNTAYSLPVRDRGPWSVENVLVEREVLPSPFAQWPWTLRKQYQGFGPFDYWEGKYVKAVLRPPGAIPWDDPNPNRGETGIAILIAQGKRYYDPIGAWGELKEIYGDQPVQEAWARRFTSRYACAWQWVRTEWGAVVYLGVYDEFILEIRFEGEATYYPEAMQRLVELQDEKLGRWVEATRAEPPPKAKATPPRPRSGPRKPSPPG